MTELGRIAAGHRNSREARVFKPRSALAMLSVWAFGSVALPDNQAQAQTLPYQSGATQVTAVIPTQVAPNQARIVLTFDQAAPRFAVAANDTTADSVTLPGAKLAPAVIVPHGKIAGLEGISFGQGSTGLTVTLTGRSALHVAIDGLGPRALAMTVTSDAAASSSHAGDLVGGNQFPPRAELQSANDVFEVVPLKYADVSEIVGLLTTNQSVKPNDNFSPQEPAFGSAGVNGFGSGIATPQFNQAGLSTASTEPIGMAIDDTVGVDRRLNAIILRGSPDRVAQLKTQIAKLDVPVTSVMLETVFVELTETGARNVGFNFTNSTGQIAVASYQFNRGGITSGAGSVTADTTRPWGAASVSLQVALAAQVQAGQGKIISRPRIAAQSGSTAKIITGDALPILTSIALSGVNAVQQQVQYVNVGVTLQIAPRVSADGNVTSHIFAVVSTVTGVSQGYPTISQREASTMATVQDGESFVIGGLTQENRLQNHGKVPLLGDLPVIGTLFRNETSSKTKTDLYIVVTPHIIRGGAARTEQDLGRAVDTNAPAESDHGF